MQRPSRSLAAPSLAAAPSKALAKCPPQPPALRRIERRTLADPSPITLPPIAMAPRAQRPRVVADPSMASAFVAFARAIAPFVAAELNEGAMAPADDWIDQHGSPLGRRLHCAAAREGRLAARKVGRRWLVRRTDLEAFIHAHRKAPSPAPEPQSQDEGVRKLLAECELEYCHPPSGSRRWARG